MIIKRGHTEWVIINSDGDEIPIKSTESLRFYYHSRLDEGEVLVTIDAQAGIAHIYCTVNNYMPMVVDLKRLDFKEGIPNSQMRVSHFDFFISSLQHALVCEVLS